jgi:hypothetical protein
MSLACGPGSGAGGSESEDLPPALAFEPLASVLATEPDPVVVDEPTRGVDPERKLKLALLLRA